MSTTKKSGTTRATDPVTAAEETLRAAQLRLAQLQAEQEGVADSADELRDRLRAGDSTVTSAMLASAQYDRERCDLLISHARREIKTAEEGLAQAQAMVSPDVATWLAAEIESDPFGFALYAFKVIVGHAPPRPKVTEPTAWLAQRQPTKHSGDGTASGAVGVHVVLPDTRAKFDHQTFLQGAVGLRNRGKVLKVDYSNGSVRPGEFICTLEFTGLVPDRPAVRTVPSDGVKAAFGKSFAEAVQCESGQVNLGVHQRGDVLVGLVDGYWVPAVGITPAGFEILDQRIAGRDLDRDVKLTLDVHLRGDASPDRARRAIDKAAKDLRLAAGLGRVVGHELVQFGVVHGDRKVQAQASITFNLVGQVR